MAKILRFVILLVFFSIAGKAFASGGTCPSNSPVQGSNCYFIAANGADSNSGTSESTPWLHAPGMPSCTSNCAAVTPASGEGFIFRGGDTWHEGNSSLSPYTGGTWDTHNWWGNLSTCVYEGTQSGCIYYGVDPTWFSGSSWARPIFNGDNPLSTSTVASCAYQTGSGNQLAVGAPNVIFDSFEFTGLCTNWTNSGTTYLVYYGTGTSGQGMFIEENLYFHGWTATAVGSAGALLCTVVGGGNNGLQSLDHIVVDGSDSDPGACAWGTFPSFYHFRDSYIGHTTQGVGQWCHDIHDNIFEYFKSPDAPTHGNILECNYDADGTAPGQPANTPNVFYNNIVRHDNPNFGPAGQVHLWFCPTAIPEYWFNNLMYDVADENYWDIAGPPTYSCTNSGGQHMFNNTLVDGNQPCNLSPNNTGGQYLTVLNEHLINSPVTDKGSPGCTGIVQSPSASNISMTDAAALSQGYLTTGGNTNTNTCANEGTKPCGPSSSGSGTVATGTNQQAYCKTLASYTSEPAISFDAANACKSGTSDGCSYNTTTHTTNCPAGGVISHPATSAWDSGAYQYYGLGAPKNLHTTVP